MTATPKGLKLFNLVGILIDNNSMLELGCQLPTNLHIVSTARNRIGVLPKSAKKRKGDFAMTFNGQEMMPMENRPQVVAVRIAFQA
jgi:hypothetical protein